MTRMLAGLMVLVCVATATLHGGAERDDVLWRIRREATEQSQVMATVHMLTDRFGPRLTGSPNLTAAANWAKDQMARWGLVNAHLEPWSFGRAGWSMERVSAHLVAPVRDSLVVEVLAWTPGTSGPVRGGVVLLSPPAAPSEADFARFLDTLASQVKGKMVMIGAPQEVGVSFAPLTKRLDADAVRARFRAPAAPPAAPTPARPTANGPTPAEIDRRLNETLVSGGALVRLNDAGRDHGQIRAFQNRTYDPTKAPPTLVVRHEDYGRIARLTADGPVELEVDIAVRTHPEGATAHNVIAEIAGSDKANEVVMLGGHLDSWHAATGATDNAVGVAVMMDAARVLVALGVRPRRTIRVALWSGEEQGLLGSQAYVREHFGTAESPKPDFARFGGYFNIDSGTGRARGLTVFGPAEAATILRRAVAPFADLGVVGAGSTSSRARGGSDHTSFNEAGLPGISVLQDPIEYQSHSWHTNLDTYERVVPEDAVASVIAVAGAVYELAMREELLPRFSTEQMPPPRK